MRRDYYPSRRPLYRSRDGMIFGVCKGLAQFTEIPVLWVRLIMLVVFIISGFFPIVLLYIVAAILMKPEPVMEPDSEIDWDFYNSWACNRSTALARLKRKFNQLERRARRMENVVTAREFDWEERLKAGN